jgi:SepF-like predicted cell division protein (DUF552 family)
LSKKQVKIVKYQERTKQKKIIADKHEAIKELEVIKAITKIEENQQTNRNVFVNLRRLVSQNSWLVALIFGIGALTGTPIGILVKSFFKKV